MRKLTPIIAAVIGIGAGPALAGSPAPAEPEQPVMQPAPVPVSTTPDWTGFYGGGQIGYGDVDSNVPGFDGDGVIGGLTAGYDYDLGNWVVGGGLDYDWADIGLGGGTDLENVFRAKLRGGYKIGNGLLYATGGYANADTNNAGDDDGYFVGAGYEHLVTQQFSLGGEVLYHDFDNFNSTTTDIEATTVQMRGTFRF